MATYSNSAELLGKTLTHGDTVVLKDLKYKVNYCFLYLESLSNNNNKIFDELNLDKKEFCAKHYGYESGTGNWPLCKDYDYPALTRVVMALFEIIEKDQLKHTFKVGDIVKVKSYEYAKSIGKTGSLFENRFGGIHKINHISVENPKYHLDNNLWYYSEVLEPYTEPVKEEPKEESKFKVGDLVRVKSLDWYNANKDKHGNISSAVFVASMAKYCGKITTISKVTANCSYELTDCDTWIFADNTIEKVEDIPMITPVQNYDNIACASPKPITLDDCKAMFNYDKPSNKVECSSEFKFTVNKPKKVFF